MSEPAFRNEKYEATGETKNWFGVTLHRIRAVADIAALGITIGTLGGWIENPENLQVYGDAWVYGNAQVYGDARVYGNAQVYGNARVYGDAWVYGDAQVYGDAWVYGNARVSPVTITGLTWTVTIADREMVIGCQRHEIDRWWKFSDRQIAAMDSKATEFWAAHKSTLQAICQATGRPFAKVEAEAAA